METTLADLIDRALARTGEPSMNALAKHAQKRGLTLTHTTLSQIRSGRYKSQPKRPTLEAIAFLAGVSFTEAQRAAGVLPSGPPFRDEVPPEWDNLTPKQRGVIKAVGWALLDTGASDTGRSSKDVNRVMDDPTDVAYVTEDDLDDPDGLLPSG